MVRAAHKLSLYSRPLVNYFSLCLKPEYTNTSYLCKHFFLCTFARPVTFFRPFLSPGKASKISHQDSPKSKFLRPAHSNRWNRPPRTKEALRRCRQPATNLPSITRSRRRRDGLESYKTPLHDFQPCALTRHKPHYITSCAWQEAELRENNHCLLQHLSSDLCVNVTLLLDVL